MSERIELAGFVNAHSHTFQRKLRGRNEGGDFWSWREAMLAEADRATPESVRSLYAETYREMRSVGYTAVGEFHYLGHAEALAAYEAAGEAGVELVVLYTAYERGGLDRFRQATVAEYLELIEDLAGRGIPVGLAPHSVRACSSQWLEEIGRYAQREGLPLHVHADEQQREIDECLAEHGVRPIELLSRTGCLFPGTTVVHATQASDAELALLGDANACVCLCPTTEANLADGFAPVECLLANGIRLCIGSDSNVRIDPLEELRELDGIARRQTGQRDVLAPDALLEIGAAAGGAALGLERWPVVEIDLDHRSLRGVDRSDVTGTLVSSCSADVVATPE